MEIDQDRCSGEAAPSSERSNGVDGLGGGSSGDAHMQDTAPTAQGFFAAEAHNTRVTIRPLDGA